MSIEENSITREIKAIGTLPPDADVEVMDPMTGDYARYEGGQLVGAGNAGPLVDNDNDAAVAGEELVRINDSGIIPTEFKVLVLPDLSEVELRAGRIPNFVVPDTTVDTYRHAAVTGRIIAMSPAAFSYHDWPEGVRLPMVGDRVIYARYAGMRVNGRPTVNDRGHDEVKQYRLLNDKDVAGILEF